MKTIELKSPLEHIQKSIDLLDRVTNKEYLLMLGGGEPLKGLYNKMSFSFNYPFPADVAMTDEIWGEYSQHSESNELMIKNTGFLGRVRWERANFYPMLSPKPIDPNMDAAGYELELLKLFEKYYENMAVILNMDLEGGVVGIMPNSEAVDSEKLILAYKGSDNKQRVTVSIKCVMEKFSNIILLVDTDEKCGKFSKIFKHETDVRKYPILVLKNMKDVTAFCYSEK